MIFLLPFGAPLSGRGDFDVVAAMEDSPVLVNDGGEFSLM